MFFSAEFLAIDLCEGKSQGDCGLRDIGALRLVGHICAFCQASIS